MLLNEEYEKNYNKRWKEDHKEQIAIHHKEWYQKNKDRIRESRKGSDGKLKPKLISHQKEYRKRNKEKQAQYSKSAAQRRRLDPAKHMYTNTKSSANKRGLDFNLTKEDIIIPINCPVLNVPLVWRTWYCPSIDRIDNSKGYVKGNIQVISRKANTMKNNASKEELVQFAKWVLMEYADEF